MPGWLETLEPWLRTGVFAALFLTLLAAERAWPRRTPAPGQPHRRLINMAMFGIDILAVRVIFPTAAVGIALEMQARGIGLLNVWELPQVVAIGTGVLVLDLAIYWQHRLFHRVPVLWRMHKVHHSDPQFDVTTGVRFHPLEILLSMLIKLVVIAALGPPAVAVLLFEILLNGTSLFNHSNVFVPLGVDRWLRWLVVTPDMHRVHHSSVQRETNSNYGFNLPWWDHLFGSYRDQPAAGHDGIDIGLDTLRDVRQLTLPRLLWLPFVRLGAQQRREAAVRQ